MLDLTSREVQGLDPEIDIIFDSEDRDAFCFIFKAGPYKGIAYLYVGVDIQQVGDDDAHEVKFNYVLVENPNNLNLDGDEQFYDQIGNLLVKMIHRLAAKAKPTAA